MLLPSKKYIWKIAIIIVKGWEIDDIYEKPMCDSFGRLIDEKLYWHNTGLSRESIERIKEYKRQKVIKDESLGMFGERING